MIYVFSLVLIISFIASFVFFFKKSGDKFANKLIATLLMLFTYYLFYAILYWSYNLEEFALIRLSYYIPMALFGPVFYYYVQRVLYDGRKIKILDFVHLSPLILVFFVFRNYIFLNGISKLKMLNNFVNQDSFDFLDYLFKYMDIILVFSMIVYFILIFRMYLKSDRSRLNANVNIWTRILVYAYLGFSASFTIDYVLIYTKLYTFTYDYFITSIIVFMVFIICYFAFYRTEIFDGKPIQQFIPIVKYKKTGLSQNYSLELKLKLINLMTLQKIYLRNNIGLADIAEELNVSRNHASQVINEHFGMSFYDFVNSYRINDAKGMIDNRLNMNFVEIAYTVGFNNRVSFYKAFKKNVGTSPSDYLNNNKTS